MHKILARSFGFDVRTERKGNGALDVQVARKDKAWATCGQVEGSKEAGWDWFHQASKLKGHSPTRTDALQKLLEAESGQPTPATKKRGKGRPKGYSPVLGKKVSAGGEEELQSFSLKLTRQSVEKIREKGGRPFVRSLIERELEKAEEDASRPKPKKAKA